MSFKRILVATDFSDCSARAIEVARDLARATGARILLCHALDAPEANTLLGGSLKPLLNLPDEERKCEERLREEIAARGIGDVCDEVVVLVHRPSVEIARAAGAEGCDLICLGTHGRGALERLILGSVAQRTLQESSVPVLVVPARG